MIIQDAFEIPNDIATGLATGDYRRIGGVVRYATGTNKGQIVKLLQPTDSKANDLSTKVLQFAELHKKGVGISVICVTVAGLAIWGCSSAWKNHESKVLIEFRSSLKTYIDAIRNGNMDIDKINFLMNSLNSLKKHKNYEKYSIKLSTEELDVLVGRIYEYTIILAHDNSIELSDEELHPNDSAIVNLESHLITQKRIFEAAA